MELKQCYALLIGINQYEHSSVPDLDGCLQDAERFRTYLEAEVDTKAYELHLKTLYSDQAPYPTRANIIEQIQQHLGQAKEGDLALLFYAGHGSRERVPVHFYEADGNFQTLVPQDARQEDSTGQPIRNILDKELRLLFHKIHQATAPQIIFIQDSCHATGSTRQHEQQKVVNQALEEVQQQMNQEFGVTRSAPPIPVPRFTHPTDYEASTNIWTDLDAATLAQYYTAFANDIDLLETILTNSNERQQSPFEQHIPAAPHLHLAACAKNEYAYELKGKGGIFTANLLEILSQTNNNISYQDVFNRIRMNISGLFQQSPSLSVVNLGAAARHQVFLDGLLRHEALGEYRDRDAFTPYYPVVPKGRSEWQLKAGELLLLPNLQGKIKAVPIEVFFYNEAPKGLTNAVITYVGATYSIVELQNFEADRRKHRNQLYAMIPAKYLRRWRLPVVLGNQQAVHPIQDWLPKHPLARKFGTYKNGGGPIVQLASDPKKASHQIKLEDGWFALYNAQTEALCLKASAGQDPEQAQGVFSLIQVPDDTTVYRLEGKNRVPQTEAYALRNTAIEAITPLLQYLVDSFERIPTAQRTGSFLVAIEIGSSEHAFQQFLEKHDKTLEYYRAFINWTTPEKAQYRVEQGSEGFEIYPIDSNYQVPLVQPTKEQSDAAGFEVILTLQKMAKWRSTQQIHNSLQLQSLEQHQLGLELRWYTNFPIGASSRTSESLQIDLNDTKAYQATETAYQRGYLLDPVDLGHPLHFLSHEDYPSSVFFEFDLSILHQNGSAPLFVSALLLDSNFGIFPLQPMLGNALLPPMSEENSGGRLQLSQLQISRPLQLQYYPDILSQATFYIKLFFAYERFDVAALLQEPLPAPRPKIIKHENSRGQHRAQLKQVIPSSQTGQWLTFLLPLTISQSKTTS